MNRREASKNETRQLILDAARELFAQKGLEDCTLRDIARQAGVSPASIVVHFKSKTALLEEALNRDIEKAMTELMSLPEGQGLLERLVHLTKGFFRFYDTNRPLYRALISRTIFEPRGDTPHITKLTERYLRFVASLIETEKGRGLIRSEVDTPVAGGALFSLYLGVLIMFFRQPEITVEMAADLLAAMTAQYLQGIMR